MSGWAYRRRIRHYFYKELPLSLCGNFSSNPPGTGVEKLEPTFSLHTDCRVCKERLDNMEEQK